MLIYLLNIYIFSVKGLFQVSPWPNCPKWESLILFSLEFGIYQFILQLPV